VATAAVVVVEVVGGEVHAVCLQSVAEMAAVGTVGIPLVAVGIPLVAVGIHLVAVGIHLVAAGSEIAAVAAAAGGSFLSPGHQILAVSAC